MNDWDYPGHTEFNDPHVAHEVAKQLTALHGRKYTVTGGLNGFAVRRLTPWNATFLEWRRKFYREFGMVP